MIVDFSVVGDPHGIVFVSQRLVSGIDIDNAQSAMSKASVTILADSKPLIIGSPMTNPIQHSFHNGNILISIPFTSNDSSNTTQFGVQPFI